MMIADIISTYDLIAVLEKRYVTKNDLDDISAYYRQYGAHMGDYFGGMGVDGHGSKYRYTFNHDEVGYEFYLPL